MEEKESGGREEAERGEESREEGEGKSEREIWRKRVVHIHVNTFVLVKIKFTSSRVY